jgi:uncharacterized protein with LGFP repeats
VKVSKWFSVTAPVAAAVVLALTTGGIASATPYPGPNGPRDVHGYIEQAYVNRYGGASGPLGGPVTNEYATPTKPGAYNYFANGSIYWSPATGAWKLDGAIAGGWAATGWENGPLGFPVADESPIPGGWWQPFQGGKMMFSPSAGSHAVRGLFYNLYAANGNEAGWLRYPTTNEVPLVRGGVMQGYQGGVMYVSPDSRGAHTVGGAILSVWGSIGYERGTYGYPRTDERRNADGNYYQNFVGGTVVWYSYGGSLTLRDDVDCGDPYMSQSDFQWEYELWGDRYGDVYDLDANRDGIACN